MPTVRTAQLQGREAALGRREPGGTNFAEELPFGAVIPVEKRFGSLTAGTGTVIRDIVFRAAADRTDLLAITFFKVRDEIFISPVLPKIGDQGKFVNFELLIFWEWESSKAHCLSGIYLQIKLINQQFCW